MPLSRALNSSILNHILGGPDYTRVATVYVALSSTTPTTTGTNVTEPSGGGYARVAVTNNATNWPSAGGTSLKSNGTVITFPLATATWLAGVNLTHAVIYDAPTAGNFMMFGALVTPKPVILNDTASFAIGAIDLSLNEI